MHRGKKRSGIVRVRSMALLSAVLLLAIIAAGCGELFDFRGPELPTYPDLPPIERDKFLGNLWTSGQRTDWLKYWNQVTPENEGKWESVQRNDLDSWNWGPMDEIYGFAQHAEIPIRFHVLVWGSQQPSWMNGLSKEDQRDHIENWFRAVANRYPDLDYIEVVNEPLHDPPIYRDALGGDNDTDGTGWDWILNSFRLARNVFGPDAKLAINEYSVLGDGRETTKYLEIINILLEEDLVDVIGVQGHAFATDWASPHALKTNLDRLAATGLTIQITEMDIRDDPNPGVPNKQLEEYQRVFPVFWEHPAVEGITLWGWRPGMWMDNAELVDSSGNPKPALIWLMDYVDGN